MTRATASVRFRGMRVGLPKGEAVASEGRKYNDKVSDAPDSAAPNRESTP